MKTRVTVCLSDDALIAAKRLAESERRSFSNYIEVLILRDVAADFVERHAPRGGGVAIPPPTPTGTEVGV